MIEISTKSFVIVYTNHFVIVFIIQQIKLSSFSIDKLNFRLIRVSIYLSQFFLKIKHKSSNQHVVSNTLSRLFINAFKSFCKNFSLSSSLLIMRVDSTITHTSYWKTWDVINFYWYLIILYEYCKCKINRWKINEKKRELFKYLLNLDKHNVISQRHIKISSSNSQTIK